ncbi:probable protein phosphatase 2C 62 [Lactuca sativa]|uniref:PPM-type phosphatase domain-containing protein n=1 Tax=Lactuca sativa TaxID=4236 RepID=A0A9R1VJS7_LACSA|nr:probable protein phosphatase 2C 62 [Lactuca sativa]XP_023751116.1 probable protein phosphatase 2C 62 [Lactuca sativa]XP_023751117.1 probable protein phosphatase 2C 62 [Lactuca sativa]XP_023751118.1 probable protein phosphatase 2C 62 [Lactuca sativa]KAJ0206130.1 hypothetical protein LSAT_V11C500267380 [Lactuca sativa]
MSNQCSNIFNYRSFNLFPSFNKPLKPYATTLRPVFPFHGNLILIDRRLGNRKLSLHPPIVAQSSSDVVLVATTEHHDGSLIFQFGDASEVVKNDEVEEIERKAEVESNDVNVLDGDQDRQIVEKTTEGESVSDVDRLTEVANEITNVDIDSDIAERETNVTSDLRDTHAELIERVSYISEEEVISLQFDAKMNESLKDVESTLDTTECTAQPDDETEVQLVSVKPESIQASDVEVMDVKQPYAEDELDKVETEDASESDTEDIIPPATIHITDVELMGAANEDVNEELQDMNINGITLVDEMPASDSLGAEPLDEASQLQSVDVKVEATMEISSTEGIDVKDQAMENELQEVSTNKRNENDVAYVMPVSSVGESGPILEEDVSQPQSTPAPLKPVMQVSDIELHDSMDQNPDDVLLQTHNEIELQVELMDITQIDELHKVEPEDTTTSNTKGLLSPTISNTSDAELMDAANEDMEEGLQDRNMNEGTFIDEMPPSDPSVAEPTLDEVSQIQLADVNLEATMEVSTAKGMDVKDRPVEDELQQVSFVMPVTFIEESEPIIEEEVSQPQSAPLEFNPTMQVSDIELQDTMGLNSDDGILQVIDETEDPFESFKLETMQASHIEAMDELLEVETKDTTESDAKDSMCPETMHTSDIELTEAANGNLVEGLQEVNTGNSDENDVSNVMHAEPVLEEEEKQPCSTPVELKHSIQVSDIEVQDTKGQSLDDVILQIIEEDAGDNYIKDVERSLHQLEALLVQDEGVNHSMLEQCAEVDALESSMLVEQVANVSQVEAERVEEIYLTGYILSSGAALLEHPFKALTGGDDAYFLSSSKWLGVASGVSQWSFQGTDPGVYAQELMRTCEEIVSVSDATSNVPMTSPVELLCRGVKETNMSGSSNIMIANFNGQALHVANIGDTGFLIIRHGAVYKKSSPLLHEFHFALQVENLDDPLHLVEEHIIELDEGDIVVSATDGLFDNLYEQEIAMVVSKSLQAGMKPEEVAKVLATRAQEVGVSAFVRSPFSDAAQAAGYTGYSGGKPDNVAVIVSLVEKISTS